MSVVVRSLPNDRKSCMFRSEVGLYSSCRQWRVWEIVVSHKLVSSWKPVVYHKPEPTMISQSSQTTHDVHYIPSKAFRYISFSLQSSYDDDVIILLKASLTLVVRMLSRVHFFIFDFENVDWSFDVVHILFFMEAKLVFISYVEVGNYFD